MEPAPEALESELKPKQALNRGLMRLYYPQNRRQRRGAGPLSPAFRRHPDSETGKNRPHQPALDQRPRGCAFKKPAIDPAIMAIPALTVTLMRICVDPSASDCKSTLPACKSMNCGSSDK